MATGVEQDLLDLMLDTVTIEPQIDTDAHNNFTYGPPHEVQCMIVRAEKRILQAGTFRRSFVEGREVVSTVQVIMPTPTDWKVGINDRLTIDGQQIAIIGINAASDENGPYYTELLT